MTSYLVGKLGSHWRLLGLTQNSNPPSADIGLMKAAGYTNVIWTTQVQSYQISERKK